METETWTDADNLGEFEKATITHANGIAALEALVRDLAKALNLYGAHMKGCIWQDGKHEYCNCGLNAIRSRIPKELLP